VLVGTRFSASREALTAPQAKERIVATSGDATLRTTVFDVVRGFDGWAGITGRALRNKFTDTWHGRERELLASREAEEARYWKAVERHDFDTALIFAGEGVDLIDSVLPAAEIVRRILH